MKKIGLSAGLLAVLFSTGAIESEAYSDSFSNVYYHSSPYDFTPKASKYTASSYGIYTNSMNSNRGSIHMWPRANKEAVVPQGWSDMRQTLGKQTIINLAYERKGYGCSADIQFKLDTVPWDGARSTSSGTWQPDI
ncbi:hypothetical protein [Bacillus thuringiensis]|uniref:hypothetical protein n=2 Tax=Bacillus TaxID=1386 RepID=UPI002FBDCA12